MNAKNKSWRRWLPVTLTLVLPVTADAHTITSGVGDFFDGVLHPLTTPVHLLVLLGLGLVAGQHSPVKLKIPLTVFISVSAVALALGTTGIVKTIYPPILIGLALVAGLLVAMEKPPSPWVSGIFFAIAAVALGLDSAAETGSGIKAAKILLGTWTGLVLVVADVAFYVSSYTKWKWQKVGIRVAGSWITAASVMILAFAFRR